MTPTDTAARITKHAAKRTKERVGLSKRVAEKNAAKALNLGIRHSETRGSLNRYIASLCLNDGPANNIRIYCDTVYLFANETLITLFPLPQKYRKTAAQIWRQKNNGNNKKDQL